MTRKRWIPAYAGMSGHLSHATVVSRFDGDDALDLDRNLIRQHHVADR